MDDFRAGEAHYLSPDYQEAEVRKDFIDKFLIALGWDVNHETQKNPLEQEVKVERAVQTAAAQRRADYSLSLAPHYASPVLYVEAKKPSADLAASEHYFQVIRYANQRGHALGVLTDFEELHIVDCRFLADLDTALARKFRVYHYSDYVKPEKFAEISSLLSRAAVGGGSLAEWADKLPTPRSRSGQRALFSLAYKPPDDRLLETLDSLRAKLAASLFAKNPSLDSPALTELTQRIIDRLVFIRFLEDKQIESEPIIPTLGDTGASAWEDFIAVSRKLDAFYNGIVFKYHPKLDAVGELRIDNAVFEDVLDSFDYYKSQYLFTDIPLHILGSIYERFLGNIIVVGKKGASLQPKPEVRKAGGVYYTPSFIVNYIVDHTVGKAINGKKPKEIEKLKFADISSGSGSFLLGIYNYLIDYITRWYNANPKHGLNQNTIRRDGAIYLSLEAKGRILTDNIYGVDIDPQAVEVSQLSLYLRLLEDETMASTRQYMLDFHRPLLPSLAGNVKCGNSLIDFDFPGALFATVPGTGNPINAFKWKTEFGSLERDGGYFDAVVGNPPYVLLQDEFRDDEQLKYFRETYDVASYKIDTYHLFMEKAISLTRSGGRCALITPANFLTNNHLDKLRQLLLRAKIDHIVVIDKGVFHGISVDTAITVVEKAKPAATFPLLHATPEHERLKATSRKVVDVATSKGSAHALFAADVADDSSKIWAQMERAGRPLGASAHINFGKQLRDREKYTTDVIEIPRGKSVPETHVQCLTGKDVDRYEVRWGRLACLRSNVAQRGGCWDEERHAAKDKLLTRQIGKYPTFGMETSGYHCLNTVFMVNPFEREDAYFLLAVLNTQLVRLYWVHKYYDQRRTFPKIKGTYLKGLPIPAKVTSAEKRHLAGLARTTTDLYAQLRKATTEHAKTSVSRSIAASEASIEERVRRLYGLSVEMDAVVDSLTPLLGQVALDRG